MVIGCEGHGAVWQWWWTRGGGNASKSTASEEGAITPVHIVAQEQVVDVGDVARGGRRAILLKQPHQVAELAMKVTKDLYGSCSQWEMVWVGACRKGGVRGRAGRDKDCCWNCFY